ncbi:Uncharacterised protein [Vibrio cholerae]|nr:Uncharacterised protein [Vibrio cholerae]
MILNWASCCDGTCLLAFHCSTTNLNVSNGFRLLFFFSELRIHDIR